MRRDRPRTPATLGSLALLALVLSGNAAHAEAPDAFDAAVDRPYFRLESAVVRNTAWEQHGRGYQSRAGPARGPGDETLFVWEPQVEVQIAQGDHVTHTFHIPVDIVTAASPDAVDAVSQASRQNEAGTFDWTATHKAGDDAISLRTSFHLEENYRSWLEGIAFVHSLAEDNATIGLSAFASVDSFEKYHLDGSHFGRDSRDAFNVNAAFTQLLSTTTTAMIGYGFTAQTGLLSNGFNIVPTSLGDVELERLPVERNRHAATARLAQWLPWSGALKASYRFYADDWGAVAHSFETELDQRLLSWWTVGATYRVHRQSAVSFFTTRTDGVAALATADSDLARFVAQTVGFKVAVDYKLRGLVGTVLHVDVEAERYFRSNDLHVNVLSCSVGFLR